MPIFRYLKRKWLLGRPFPEEWEPILRNKVPVYRRLPNAYRDVLKKRLVILLDEKKFEGCGGLSLTDEIRIVIAAYASVLILEDTSDYYGDLQAILVYPSDYIAPVEEEDPGGVVSVGHESRSGEYWSVGSIVLSWRDIQKDIYSNQRAHNLIYHEFSHLLDDRYGLTAGVDINGQVLRDDEWSRVLSKAYRQLIRASRLGQKHVLDAYGAKNPAELFSVATEAFIEIPDELYRALPDLYKHLQSFYGFDPRRW